MKWNDPLSESSPVPLWFQIAERLRTAIKKGQFKPGQALPSESRLNEVFGISRATSRTALDHLERDGLISRRSGKGSIVLSRHVDQPAYEMSGFSEDMRRRGLKPSYETRFVGPLRAPTEVREALEIKTDSRIFQSRRQLKADDEPIGFAISWLSPSLFRRAAPPTAHDLNHGSLYEWLSANCAVKIASAQEFIEAAVAEKEMATELSIPIGSAVLIVRRLSRGLNGLPVEYAILHFRADRYRFHLQSSS